MWNPYETLPSSTRRLLGLGAVFGVVLVWSMLSGLEIVAANKLPSPRSCVEAFGYLAWDADRAESRLLNATLASCGRVVFAGMLVVVIGIPLGILMGAAPRINAALSPLIDPFRSAPIVAILPILVMWLGIGESMKIVFLFLGAVVYLIPLVRDAVVAVPSTYYISARDLGATPFEAIRHAVIPIAMPRIADAIIVAISIMWTYITVAEYVNADQGLGNLLSNSRRMAAMDQVFVSIFVIIALALCSWSAMTWLKNQLFDWEIE